MNVTMDTDKLSKEFKAIMVGIGKATITQTHIALEQAASIINDKAVDVSNGAATIPQTKLTKKRYKSKVKTKQYKQGKKFIAGSYRLHIKRKQLIHKKIPHKRGNRWIRVSLRTQVANSESNPLYWSFLKSFYANATGKDRTQKKTGKNLGHLQKYNFFKKSANQNFKTIQAFIKQNMRKIKATKTGA